MRDDFLLYYERELAFVRQMGQEFAEKYPKIASRLVLEADKCDDPHVERLIEAFAFLAARVHLKIDDDFPEITESLLTVLYPHYIRPTPSMAIVEMKVDPERGKLTSGLDVPAGTMLFSRPVVRTGERCQFRTCYDTTLWPIVITETSYQPPDRLNPPVKTLDAAGAIRLLLRGDQDVQLDKLQMKSLRFHLQGDSKLVFTLYELLLNNCVQVMIRDPLNTRRPPAILPGSALRAVGFREEEGIIPYPRRSFLAYRLLHEYFTFPDKYLFLELNGLEQVWAQGFREQAELIFLISPFELENRREILEVNLKPETFRLGCTPVINLFEQTCEPILIEQRKYEYPVVPDNQRISTTEIFSVEEVVSIEAQTRETVKFEPFYSYRHAAVRDKKMTFWISNRRLSTRKNDDGTEIFLSLVDLGMRPVKPGVDSLTVRTLCTNRDLPVRLTFGNEQGDLFMEGTGALKSITCLRKPTPPIRPPIGKSIFWRLISHLSLNYLSLVDEGRDALMEILKLYNFSDSAPTARQIDGIMGVRSSRQFARVISENGISFARGVRAEIDFDEDQFVGGGVFLFASVLEYFLGLYATMNSFSQLVARSRQRRGVLREWPPRAGQRILM